MYKVFYVRPKYAHRGYVSQRSFKSAKDCVAFVEKLQAAPTLEGEFVSIEQSIEVTLNDVRDMSFYELG